MDEPVLHGPAHCRGRQGDEPCAEQRRCLAMLVAITAGGVACVRVGLG